MRQFKFSIYWLIRISAAFVHCSLKSSFDVTLVIERWRIFSVNNERKNLLMVVYSVLTLTIKTWYNWPNFQVCFKPENDFEKISFVQVMKKKKCEITLFKLNKYSNSFYISFILSNLLFCSNKLLLTCFLTKIIKLRIKVFILVLNW